jgi:hypothetical protein
MLLYAVMSHVFDLPDAIAKYLRSRQRRAEARPTLADPDEEAARVLGEGLERAQLPPRVVTEVTAAFWAAGARNRRALAHMVAGMSMNGPVNNQALLAAVRSLSAAPESPPEAEQAPAAPAGGGSQKIIAADRPHD